MEGEFVSRVKENLEKKGYKVQENISYGGYLFRLVAHRSLFEIVRPGINDHFVLLSEIHNPTLQNIRDYSLQSYIYSKAHRIDRLPVGLLGGMYVFPIAVVDNITEPVQQVIESQEGSKHYFSAEFPVVVDRVANKVIYLQKNSVWKSLSYASLRRIARDITQ